MSYTDLTKSAENWQVKFPELNMLRADLPIPSGMPHPKRLKAVSTLKSTLFTKAWCSETGRSLKENIRNIY